MKILHVSNSLIIQNENLAKFILKSKAIIRSINLTTCTVVLLDGEEHIWKWNDLNQLKDMEFGAVYFDAEGVIHRV